MPASARIVYPLRQSGPLRLRVIRFTERLSIPEILYVEAIRIERALDDLVEANGNS